MFSKLHWVIFRSIISLIFNGRLVNIPIRTKNSQFQSTIKFGGNLLEQKKRITDTLIIWTSVKLMICSKSDPNLMEVWVHVSCHYLEFIIISDSKMISSRFSLLLSGLGFIFNLFYLKNFVNFRTEPDVVYCSLWIALSNPPKNWTLIFQVHWTNLKRPAIVDFPWPIHILLQVYISCLNRIRPISWFYGIFVQLTLNLFVHFRK